MFTNPPCTQSPSCPRHARLCSSRTFPSGSHHCQTMLYIQCLVGFSTAGDNQRVTAFIHRSIRQGYCTTDYADITSFIDTADDTLFRQILTNPNHVLAHLLPEKDNTHYQLRPQQYDRQLIPKTTKPYSCKFVTRMLYKHSY